MTKQSDLKINLILLLLKLVDTIYYSNSSPYKKQNPNIEKMLKKEIFPLPYYFPQKGLLEKLEKKFYKMGKWEPFNYEKIKKFIIENLCEETKEFLIRKCNNCKEYHNCKKIDDIKHLTKDSLKQFYQALTLETGEFVYVKTSINNTNNLGGYLVRIKSSELIEQNKDEETKNEFFDDGSNSSIIMCRKVEYLGPVSDDTHRFVSHKDNKTGFILAKSFDKMNEKVKEEFIKNEMRK